MQRLPSSWCTLRWLANRSVHAHTPAPQLHGGSLPSVKEQPSTAQHLRLTGTPGPQWLFACDITSRLHAPPPSRLLLSASRGQVVAAASFSALAASSSGRSSALSYTLNSTWAANQADSNSSSAPLGKTAPSRGRCQCMELSLFAEDLQVLQRARGCEGIQPPATIPHPPLAACCTPCPWS